MEEDISWVEKGCPDDLPVIQKGDASLSSGSFPILNVTEMNSDKQMSDAEIMQAASFSFTSLDLDILIHCHLK